MTGEPYERAALSVVLQNTSTAAEAVHAVINRNSIPKVLRSTAANLVLAPDEGLSKDWVDAELSRRPPSLDPATWAEVLSTHAITPEMSGLLAEGRVEEFLTARNLLLEQQLVRFLGRMCEWDFENTPPLEDLLIEEERDGDDDALL